MAAEYATTQGQYGTLKIPMFGPAWERKQAEERAKAAQSPLQASTQSRLAASLPPYLATIAATDPLKAVEMFKKIYPGQALGSLPGTTSGTSTSGVASPSAPGPIGVPDILSGGGYNPLATGPAWAPGGTGGGIAGQGLNVISGLLNQHPDTSEWDQTSAERAVAGGVQGSRMAAAEGSLLRQSEIDKRNLAGLDALQPFLNRQQQTFELVERGRQAKDLLRLEQSGQMERLSAENKAKLEQIAAQGELALQEAKLRGDYGLAEASIGANTSRRNADVAANTSLTNARIGADADIARYGSRQTAPSSTAQTLIDRILRGAGITPPSSYAGAEQPGVGVLPPRTYDDYDLNSPDADYLAEYA